MVLIVLGIAPHSCSDAHRAILLNCCSGAISAWTVPSGDAATRASMAEDIASDQGTFTVLLTCDFTNRY